MSARRRVDEPVRGRPRVLVLYASQRLTGPGRGLLQLIQESRDRAHFTLCSFGHPEDPSSDFHREATERGVEAEVIRQRFALDPTMIGQVLSLARRGSYDLVQSHGYKTHVLAALVSRSMGIPWVAVSHGWTDENVRIRLYNLLDRILLRSPDTVIAVSPLLEGAISRVRKGRRTVTILNAIEPSRFDLGEDRAMARARVRSELDVGDHVPLLAVIGRLSPEKGQDQFLEAFNALHPRDPGPVAVLVGEGPEEENLRSLASDLGIDPSVRFAGFRRDVGSCFLAADLVVLPSRSEGLPNVVLEAHAMGRPVVAFDVGGVGEVIRDGETGWLVQAGDVAGLARAIDYALDHPERRSRITDNASDRLFPKFGVETRVDAFLAEYRRLCPELSR